MPYRRFIPLAVAVAALAASGTAAAQPAKPADPFRKEVSVSGEVRTRVNEFREGKRNFGEKDADKEAMRRDLDAVARSVVYPLTHAERYKQSEPFKGELRPTNFDQTLEDVFQNAERFILKPSPSNRMTQDQGDYILEFGKAMDRTLQTVLTPTAPDYIRVNAARMLAVASKSGAEAFGPTILKLLNDPKTRPEVLIWTLRAAENLLGAYHTRYLPEVYYYRHTVPDDVLHDLILVLEKVVYWDRPPFAVALPPKAALGAVPPATGAKPPTAAPVGQLQNETKPTDEQLRVLKFYRLAAIRALAQVRIPIVAHPKGTSFARPLWVLGLVAVKDNRIPVEPSPEEIAQATLGLTGYQVYRGVEIPVLLDMIAVGITNFARNKADDPTDKSIPWRIDAAKLNASLEAWKKLSAANGAAHAGKVASLADVAGQSVLTPLEKLAAGAVGSVPDLESLNGWRNRNAVPALTPFSDFKQFELKPAVRN